MLAKWHPGSILQLHHRATGWHRMRTSRSRYVRSNRLIGTPRCFTCERAEPKADMYLYVQDGAWGCGKQVEGAAAAGHYRTGLARSRETSLEHEELAAPSHARQNARGVAARLRHCQRCATMAPQLAAGRSPGLVDCPLAASISLQFNISRASSQQLVLGATAGEGQEAHQNMPGHLQVLVSGRGGSRSGGAGP